MALTANDIQETCYRVMALGKIAGWQFKSLPVVLWEFPTVDDYMRARVELLHAMGPVLSRMVHGERQFRRVADHIEELDCYGVTFRLVCTQKTMTRQGPYGVADIDHKSVPVYRNDKPRELD